MAIKFVTTDLAKWGVGTGLVQDAVDVDENFWVLLERIVALEALPDPGAVIQDFFIDGDQLTIVMDDYTLFGPYTLPMWTPTFAGTWTPATIYQRGTIFTANGKTYLTVYPTAFTSEATFDEDENDGLGNDYYAVLLEVPAGILPTGGAAGMALVKSTSDDFDVTWSFAVLPIGGGTGEILVKNSPTDYDAGWAANLLESLGDVALDTPQQGDILRYHVSDNLWINEPLPETSNRNDTITALATSGAVTLDPTLGDIFTVTPTNDITLSITDETSDGARITLIVTSSGTTPYTITFGGAPIVGTKGSIYTGVVTGIVQAVTLVFDGTRWIETSRTGVGRKHLWIPADRFIPRTTNGAALNTVELASNNQMLRTLDFDPTTQEFAQYDWVPPKSWDRQNLSFIPYWSHDATVTNFGVVWAMDCLAVSNDDPLGGAYGSSSTSTDTGGTTDDLYVGPESIPAGISGSPAAADMIHVRMKRNVASGSDNLAVDARLHGIMLIYTTNQVTDD